VDRAEPSPLRRREAKKQRWVGHGGQGRRPLLHTESDKVVGHGGQVGPIPLLRRRK
jgi:hypothetical protein